MTWGSRRPPVSHSTALKCLETKRECARWWRVTGRTPCPTFRAHRTGIEADLEWRVARDRVSRGGLSHGVAPAASVGRATPAAAAARRREPPRDRGSGDGRRGRGRAMRGRRGRRRAVPWRRAPGETTADTRCSDDGGGASQSCPGGIPSARATRGARRRELAGEPYIAQARRITTGAQRRRGGGPLLASGGGSNLASVEAPDPRFEPPDPQIDIVRARNRVARARPRAVGASTSLRGVARASDKPRREAAIQAISVHSPWWWR